MVLRLSKRAIFFSIISLLISALTILVFSSFLAESFDRETIVLSAKTEFVDSIVDNIEYYASTELQVATYAALENLVGDFRSDGAFNQPYPLSSMGQLERCLLNGTFDAYRGFDSCAGNYSSFSNALRDLDSSHYPRRGLFDLIEKAYPELQLSSTVYDVSIVQKDTYFIQVNASLQVFANTSDASWTKYLELSENISLIGQTDPLSVGTNAYFKRNLTLRPDNSGFIFSASIFQNNYSYMAEFSQGGYVFRDTSAPSFFDVLDGNFPTTITPNFSPYGYTSFIPGYSGGNSLYVNNQTASVAHLSFANNIPSVSEDYSVVFDSINLTRINTTGLNTNQTFPLDYLTDILTGTLANAELWHVSGCCDASGCNPLCQ